MRTIGGHAVSDEWTDENAQRLGGIVKNLMSSVAAERRTGYIEYFELRRNFTGEAWDQMINLLEDHRLKTGHRSIAVMISEIRESLIKTGTVAPMIEIKPMPAVHEWSDKCEQVSLF